MRRLLPLLLLFACVLPAAAQDATGQRSTPRPTFAPTPPIPQEKVEADISTRTLEVTTGFTGHEIIVFGSVDKWASVFEGIDVADTATWYSGTNVHALTTTAFSSRLHGLSSGLGSMVQASAASTPGGSGVSGFSFGSGFSGGGGGGGFSGGGGGGGGGRSW